jgi:hypothetical protein
LDTTGSWHSFRRIAGTGSNVKGFSMGLSEKKEHPERDARNMRVPMEIQILVKKFS